VLHFFWGLFYLPSDLISWRFVCNDTDIEMTAEKNEEFHCMSVWQTNDCTKRQLNICGFMAVKIFLRVRKKCQWHTLIFRSVPNHIDFYFSLFDISFIQFYLLNRFIGCSHVDRRTNAP
jgi:hypothetical protein